MFLFRMCLFDQFIILMRTHVQTGKTEVFENDLDDDFARILGILCKCAGAHAH